MEKRKPFYNPLKSLMEKQVDYYHKKFVEDLKLGRIKIMKNKKLNGKK
jgi:hypothetical protein